MPHFCKKPVVIEAVLCGDVLKSPADDWTGLPDWLKDAHHSEVVSFHPGYILIKTLEGDMVGEKGDFIIRGIAGEIYPCKPEIFAATYEPVNG